MSGEVGERVGMRAERADEAPIQPEQVNVGDRIARSNRPIAISEPFVGDLEHLDRTLAAGAPRRMHGRGDERHPGDNLRLGVDVAGRPQICRRKAAGEVVQHRCDFGKRPAPDDQRRHLTFRVERQVFGRALLLFAERDPPRLKWHPDLVHGDMRRHRARSRRHIEREHRPPLDSMSGWSRRDRWRVNRPG
jgi:hypothetical protein